MTRKYIPQEIEPKWQKKWEADGLYHAPDFDPVRPKWYFLTMLPYTSGDIHIGHWYAMTPSDAAARFKRMQGYNVMFPIGHDAFGLPAEEAAIRNNIHPWKWTWDGIVNMRRQLRLMGAMWDWEREMISCDPAYYKWTQWFFLQFYKHGLAYRAKAPVDWCPHCNTSLAREQVWGEDRHCERCGTPVIKKELEQWFFRITKYADELLDFSGIEWPERVRLMQTNWIGRSEGVEFNLPVQGTNDVIPVFTTRHDTAYGMTFVVLAPEHPLVEKLTTPERQAEVTAYVEAARRQTEIERLGAEREKTGVFIGAYCRNPLNGERVPIFIGDYVLMTYGTGAIQGVPAHDERDFVFAQKYGLPIPVVIAPPGWKGQPLATAYIGPGVMVNSGPFDGAPSLGKTLQKEWAAMSATERHRLAEEYVENWLLSLGRLAPGQWDAMSPEEKKPHVDQYATELEKLGSTSIEGKEAVADYMTQHGIGQRRVNYRLRDWLISRQRYWGAPIPIVYCQQCGMVPVPEEQLPVLLPEDAEFRPTGESPLKYHQGFLHTTCPQCGGPAERETDTMDTFMCSSWYHMRYTSPGYDQGPFDPAKAQYWLPVDQYTGGIEHATMHLIYTRFFTKACADIGILNHREPMLRLFNQGIILAEDRAKMSKSRPEVVINPDKMVARYGADTVRAYLMFMGPWDMGGPWSSTGIGGVERWLRRVWDIVSSSKFQVPSLAKPSAQPETWNAPTRGAVRGLEPGTQSLERALRRVTHQTIQKVTNDYEKFRFNTMIAALMEFTNTLMAAKDSAVYGTAAWNEAIDTLLLLLAPACPHIAEELWVSTGHPYSVHQQAWPTFDPALAAEEIITLVVQINGKVRDKIEVPASIGEEEAKKLALSSERAAKWIEGKQVTNVLYVPGKLVSIAAK
jgi:leucyl-tRNA synthetase